MDDSVIPCIIIFNRRITTMAGLHVVGILDLEMLIKISKKNF